jgi:4-oxalocrotonate tautomerase
MPYVNIKVTREQEAVTREQKAQVIAGVSEVLHRVLGKDPTITYVVIDEVDLDNWGVGGLTVPEFRARSGR